MPPSSLDAPAAPAAPLPPTRAEALRYWLKLGCISFGGPAGQIAIMHEDLVERRRWISEGRFLHALNYCMLLPGPEAQQLATYIGWLLHRTWGGIVAGGLFVLPSLLLLIALSWIYVAFGHVPAIAGIFYGIKPAVTALVVHAAWRVGSRTLRNGWLWGIAAAAFVAIFALKLPFPLIVLAAGALGYLGGRLTPRHFSPAGGHGPRGGSHGPAVIDDDTPTPAHARFSWRFFSQVLAASLGLWALSLGLLAAAFGWQGALTQMGWFFTKAALLTFGGAYAVLPYLYQGAVDHYHWLTATQMMDGLALGETTPGPLIMVVSFVGFLGGWSTQVFGPDALLPAGAAAALVVTFFTFLPSFAFILLGGPFIESTHGRLGFTAPLTGITAAVVGVIANLAVFFAWHVLWPQGWAGPFDWPSALLGLAAAAALLRWKVGVIPVVVGAGLAGLAITLARQGG
ncbi:chromate transporter, chromate ion transporter family protein [Delftia acidovorans]|uniref:chromate efflux transporter n=1 Tax=Delftia acidovorans TaxID=80866 RepID=UPI000504AA31|nr:chromate efflux transporter [Delftia acidovorans]KFJ09159.1 chromate transporter, chromate ion transporter family protein [Delftia acidovorans]MCA1067229.1 Chromate transport protein [Delftia acidovorans]QQB52443.1 chromate efflux transporter [Delftia acidovorans]